MTRFRAFFTALLVFAVAAVLFAPDAVLGHGVYWFHDFRHHHYPWRVWAAEQWRAGEVPWWAAGAANGFPLLAEGQGGFLYPPTMLLFALLPGSQALNATVVLHQVWAALGAWALCRALGLRGTAPLVAGIAWAFGGFLVSHGLYLGMQNAAAWLGWALWATERRQPAVAALAVGMMGLAGHPQAAAFGGLLFGLHALARRAWPVIGGGALGVLIAAPQLLATLELSRFSMRDGGVADLFAQIGRLPPQELVGAVLPYAFGFDRPADVAQTYYHRGLGYWGAGENHWEMCFYLGIPVVVLALAGWRRGRLWAALVLVALLLMLGGPAWELLRKVPGFGYFRFPARFALWVSLGVAVMAALGADRLRRARRPWLLRRRVLVVAGLFFTASFAGFGLLRAAREPILAFGRARFAAEAALPPPPETGVLLRAALPAPEPEDAAAVPAKVERIYADLGRSLSPASGRVLLPFFLLVATALALRHPRLMLLLVFADLWAFGHDYQARVDISALQLPPPWLEPEMRQPGGPRLTVLDRRIDPTLDTRMLTSSLGLPLGTSDVIIPSPLLLVRNEAVLGKAGLDVGDTGPQKAVRFREYRDLARRMGLRWIASVHDLDPLRPVASMPGFSVWEDPSALPRARMVPCRKAAADAEAAYALLLAQDPERVVVVEEGDEACGEPGEARVLRYEDQLVEVEATGPGTLVLADSWYPRWTASVDGVSTPILRGDVLFRAVPVEAGTHRVLFRFDPGIAGTMLLQSFLLMLLCVGASAHAIFRPGFSASKA